MTGGMTGGCETSRQLLRHSHFVFLFGFFGDADEVDANGEADPRA